MKTSISKKNCLYFCWLVPLTWAGHNLFKWLKIVTFQSKFDKTTSFYQHAQLLHHVLQKRIESLEFVPCVNFEFVDSLKITLATRKLKKKRHLPDLKMESGVSVWHALIN